jgi:tetratricopeptide (TPR) repeat protein
LSQGKLEDAKKIYAGLAVLNPYDPYYHLALGAIAQRGNQLEDAARHYSRAIEINPTIGAAYANRAEVLIVLGKLNDAIGDLVQSVALSVKNPNDASALRARATLAAIQKQISEIQKQKAKA